jgi:hypothetical protein
MHVSKKGKQYFAGCGKRLTFFTLNTIRNKIHFRGLHFKDLKVSGCMLSGKHCSLQLQTGPVFACGNLCGFLGAQPFGEFQKG